MKIKKPLILPAIAFFLLWPLLFSCGGGTDQAADGGDTGSLTASLLWPDGVAGPAPSGVRAAGGTAQYPEVVATVRFQVSGSGMATLSQDFAFSARHGELTGVPAGSGRTLTIQGLDSSGAAIYQGLVNNILVTSGQTYDCGTVTMLDIRDSNVTLTGKVPDTGQTQSSTDTWGEDADYTINPPSYTDNGDGTVTDNVTGLIWQQRDDDTTRTWDGAGSYCSGLSLAGHTDWRLPARMELMTLVDYGTYSPAIDSVYFPATNSFAYWSCTAYSPNSSPAWAVSFHVGFVGNDDRSSNHYVRCVRGGQ